MDQIYHLPFRDWLEINKSPAEALASADQDSNDSGDNGDRGR